MAKKNMGKFFALASLFGIAAAGISYYARYKSFHKELDKDFHDFEGEDDDDFDDTLPKEKENHAERNYVTLGDSPKKEPEEETKNSEEKAEDKKEDRTESSAAIEEDPADQLQ